ncbi:unnamed protein product [Closterium sp. NIES-54]
MEEDWEEEVVDASQGGATQAEDDRTYIGSVLFNIKGLQHYPGTVNPREMVRLIREPNNAHDRNAIRVDNIRGQEVGHVEAKMACHLAPLVDAGLVAIEGLVTRGTRNKYQMPCHMCLFCSPESAPEVASRLLSAGVPLVETNSLPGSDTFGEASSSGSLQSASLQAASSAATVAAALAARRAAMSQAEQDKAVLSMFDDLACQVEADRPTADPPCHVIRSSLLPHQQRALAWMIKRESARKLPPFWKAGALESGSSSKGKRGGRRGGGRGGGRQGRGGRGRGIEGQGEGARGVEGGAGGKEGEAADGGTAEEEDGDDGGEGGGRVFTNILTKFTTDERPKALRGGILADDMGLGKTLSLLSLVAATTAAADTGETQAAATTAAAGTQGEQSRATLVVCPLSVLSNWTAQIAEHVAPGALSYYVYHGADRVRDPSFLSGFDLVFTTYNILASECPPPSASTAPGAAAGGAAGGSSAGAGRGGSGGMAEVQRADSPPPSPPSIPGCPGMLMPAYAGMPGARGRKRKAPGAAAQGQRKRGGMAGTAGGASSSSRSTAGASAAGGAGAETAGGGPLMQVKWRRVILDEAHVIKSVRTRAARAATALQAERRWAVTGTPVQNQLGDLFSLLCFLRLDPLNDRSIWTRAIERPMRERQHIGLDRLRALVLTTALRRTKDMQVNGRPLLSLPPKTVQVLPVDLLPEDRDLYDQVQEEVRRLVGGMMAQGTLMKNYATVLEMILRLRQIADHKGLCPPHVLEAIAASAAAAEEADRNQDAKAAVPLDPLLSQKLQELLAAGAADEDCPICLSPPTLPVITPCSHIFCRRCIRRVLSIQKHACPMCRAPVDEAHLVEAPPDAAEGEGGGANGDHAKGGLMEGVEGNTSAKIDALIAALHEPLQVPPRYQPSEGGDAIAGPSALGGGGGRQQLRVKSVVFSQFTRMLDLVYERLQAAGIKCCRLDGRTKLSLREKAIAEFNRVDDDSPTVFLVGLRAAGVGLNLTAASRVFLLEPWWNPAVEQQAMDRVHRIGQENPVDVVRMVAADSIEERMLVLQERKRAIARAAFEHRSAEDQQLLRMDDHHLFGNSPLSNLPTFDQLSERHRHGHKYRRQKQDGSGKDRGARRISEDASSVSSDLNGYHTDPAVHAEPSWTVRSVESAASVPPVLETFKSPAHPASYHPQRSHRPSASVAPSAHGGPEAAGSALTQYPPQFPQALRNCYSAPQPGESETCVLSRQLAGAREIKVMARDTAVCGSMVEMGAAKVLLSLVDSVIEAEEGRESMDSRYEVAEEAAAALLNLSLDKTAKHMMRSHGIIPTIVRLADITRSSPDCPDGASGNAHKLPNNAQQNDISSYSDGSAGTPTSTRTSSAHLPLRELAVAIIHSLAQSTALKEDLVDQWVVQPLVGLLREPACSKEGQKDALYALYLLSMCESGRLALAYRGAVPLLLEVALCGTQRISHLYAKQSGRFFDKAIHAVANVSEERSGLAALVSSKVKCWSCEAGGAGSDGCPQIGNGSCIEVSGLQGLFKLLANGSDATKQHVVSILHRIIRNAGQGGAQVLDEIWLRDNEDGLPALQDTYGRHLIAQDIHGNYSVLTNSYESSVTIGSTVPGSSHPPLPPPPCPTPPEVTGGCSFGYSAGHSFGEPTSYGISPSISRDLDGPSASRSTLAPTCSEASCRSIISHTDTTGTESLNTPASSRRYSALVRPVLSTDAVEEGGVKEPVKSHHVGRQRMGQLLRNVVTSLVSPYEVQNHHHASPPPPPPASAPSGAAAATAAAAVHPLPVTDSHAPSIPSSPCPSSPVPSSPTSSTSHPSPIAPRLSSSSASSAHCSSFPSRSPFPPLTPSPPFSLCPSPAVAIPSLSELQSNTRTSSASRSSRLHSTSSRPANPDGAVANEPASPPSLPPGFQRALLDCCACRDSGETSTALLERQMGGARQIRHMARDLEGCRAVMVEKGAVGALLPLLDWAEGGPGVQPWAGEDGGKEILGDKSSLRDLRLKVVEEAVTALLNLSIHPSARELMLSFGVVAPVTQMVGSRQWGLSRSSGRSSGGILSGDRASLSGSDAVVPVYIREVAAALIFSLAQVAENRTELVRCGAAEALVQLLQEPNCSSQGRTDACKALSNLSTISAGRLSMVRAGAVPMLLELALMGHAGDEYISEKALGVLANVAREEAGREAIVGSQIHDGAWDWASGSAACGTSELPQPSDSLRMASGLSILLESLDCGLERSNEFAVSALLCVARSSQKWKELLLLEAPLPSVKAVAMKGSLRAREKAQKLYELLRG